MKFTAIIPARYQSTRFPGKPLALIHGKPMICHVMERTREAIEDVWVATDHEGIADAVRSGGGEVVMTSPDHTSGTDRCAEAARKIGLTGAGNIIINVQGDEPFIQPEQIRQLTASFSTDVQIATLVREISDPDELKNPNKVKVVIDRDGKALYFSRSPIPFLRGKPEEQWLSFHSFRAHIGIYGYRADVLMEITKLAPGILETAESLEQLRWLENGYQIKTAPTSFLSFGIDTPEDLEKALELF